MNLLSTCRKGRAFPHIRRQSRRLLEDRLKFMALNGLPKNWDVGTIDKLISRDGMFVDGDWIETKDQNPNGEVRLIQLADIGDGSFKNKSARFLTLQRANELNCTFLKEGDVLVARMPDPIGRACIFPLKGENKYVTAVDVAIIRTGLNAVNNKFLMYAINCPVFRNEIEKLQSGTTRKRISRKNLATILFPLPPLAEQQRIVAKIEELFSELEAGVASLKIAQAQLKTYRQAVLKWAFEGKLTNENVSDGELPNGWTWVKLSDVAKVSGGLTKNSKREKLELKLPFLRVANVYFNSLNLTDIHTIGLNANEVERVKLKKNDLLFVEGNGSIEQIGRVAIWNGAIENCVHQNHLIKARLSERIAPAYALHFFCSRIGRDKIKEQASSTSGLHTLSLGKISKLELPLCLLGEQQRIVQEIESRLSVCDKLEETIAASLRQAEALRQSILKKAFEGKLVAPESAD
ncbi:MAG: type restriction enzyme subunit [Blastocatellia bacterium]